MFLSLSNTQNGFNGHVKTSCFETKSGDLLIEFIDGEGNIPAKLCGNPLDIKRLLKQIENLQQIPQPDRTQSGNQAA